MTRTGLRRGAAPAGPTPLMALLYGLGLLVAQSLLSRLLLPLGVPPPDLFLLTGLLLTRRLSRGSALLAAYGVGLLQDILGAGVLGLHAAGVAGGVLLVLLTRRIMPPSALGQTLFQVAAALLGQWLTFMFLTYWLRTGLVTVDTLTRVLPLSFVTTLLIAPLWERFADLMFGRTQDGLP
ncbi:hypothetical protein Dxin01_02661 [Deinococcus xinjiangensis]|uniref:Rod shape-determining protein MreD n=1 Tax=Deinococcus xinjiangensis TaxID=457454 RepID=A0ABP9VCE7_9DEIO